MDDTTAVINKIFGEIDTAQIEQLISDADTYLTEGLAKTNERRVRNGAKAITRAEWQADHQGISNSIHLYWHKNMVPKLAEIYGQGKTRIGDREVNLSGSLTVTGIEDLKFYMITLYTNPDLHERAAALVEKAQASGYKPGWVWYQLKDLYGDMVANLLA